MIWSMCIWATVNGGNGNRNENRNGKVWAKLQATITLQSSRGVRARQTNHLPAGAGTQPRLGKRSYTKQGCSQDFSRGGSVCVNFADHTHILKTTPIIHKLRGTAFNN